MQKLIHRTIAFSLSFTLLMSSTSVYAKSNKKGSSASDVNIRQIVLPSELTNLPKMPGAVYYNQSTKGKVLVPVNFWGEINRSGLHFIPVETNLISGLSMAGGASSMSRLDNIKLIRQNSDNVKVTEFDLSDGGDKLAYLEQLQPGDTIFVERDTSREDRVFYTTLVTVAVSVLSTWLLYEQINKNR
tara:strand:- start:81987 stop:82547 length:561 start_codon:yes stop_codon:yes gene_type:complete